MNDQQNTKKSPTLNVFTKTINSDGSSKIASQIGVAFAHGEGEGFNLILDAQPFPINGRIELVAFPSKS